MRMIRAAAERCTRTVRCVQGLALTIGGMRLLGTSQVTPTRSHFVNETCRDHRVMVATDPIPYVFVLVEATEFFSDIDTVQDVVLEEIRSDVARRAGLAASPASPKLGLIAVSPVADVRFRSRIAHGAGWHRGAAGSGLMALANAAETAGSLAAELAGDPAGAWCFETPAGLRRVERVDSFYGARALRIEIEVDVQTIVTLTRAAVLA